MAAFVLVDANIVVQKRASKGGAYVDLTSFVMSATLNYEGDLQEETGYGWG